MATGCGAGAPPCGRGLVLVGLLRLDWCGGSSDGGTSKFKTQFAVDRPLLWFV